MNVICLFLHPGDSRGQSSGQQCGARNRETRVRPETTRAQVPSTLLPLILNTELLLHSPKWLLVLQPSHPHSRREKGTRDKEEVALSL